jgi:leader peptidase (prepilin peptidase)/N-methyltransferase
MLLSGLLIGAVVGSFLNVCIYRIPRGISLWNPPRSFCPICRQPISWTDNIPIVSWLWRRGRCAKCGQPISLRYPIVEVLTALLFAGATLRFKFPLLLAIWLFVSVLIVATFIDLEFYLLPDVLTKGGIVAGLVASVLFPELHQAGTRLVAAGVSLAGILAGAAVLFLVSKLGKLVFGRYQVILPAPTRFSFERHSPDDTQIVIDADAFRWEDHFFRPSDKIIVHASEVEINGVQFTEMDLTFYHDRLETPRETFDLAEIRHLVGRTARARFPREAMGLGDVKLIAAIGAFTGWQGVLFTIPAASMIGAVAGLIMILLGRREWSAKIPFGPYLAAGALLWWFAGPEIVGWYQKTLL